VLYVIPFLNNNILKLPFEGTIRKWRFKCIHWLLSARACQKMHVGNCIKLLSLRRVDCVVDWNSFLVTKSFLFYITDWGKIRQTGSLLSQTEWPISKGGKKENHIWQLATTCCGHSSRNDKWRFYLQHKPYKSCTCCT